MIANQMGSPILHPNHVPIFGKVDFNFPSFSRSLALDPYVCPPSVMSGLRMSYSYVHRSSAMASIDHLLDGPLTGYFHSRCRHTGGTALPCKLPPPSQRYRPHQLVGVVVLRCPSFVAVGRQRAVPNNNSKISK